MGAKQSAGILLHRDGGAGVELLLAHPGGPYWARKDLGAWSIPKGECDPGEDLRACALRELREELGPAAPRLEAAELVELGPVRQRAGKVVHAWAAAGEFDPAALDSNKFELEWPPRSGTRREFPEVDRVGWFDLLEAHGRILPAQADFIDRLVGRLERT